MGKSIKTAVILLVIALVIALIPFVPVCAIVVPRCEGWNLVNPLCHIGNLIGGAGCATSWFIFSILLWFASFGMIAAAIKKLVTRA